jgi:predicted site-specific integrase-resolvase
MSTSTSTKYWGYEDAPDSPVLKGTGITSRQLRRAVQLGKISYIKPTGGRVLFAAEHLEQFLARSAVQAVR